MATWLTLEEAAKHLRIGKSTMYRLARGGDLPAHRVGRVWRFDADELDEWLKAGKHYQRAMKLPSVEPRDASGKGKGAKTS